MNNNITKSQQRLSDQAYDILLNRLVCMYYQPLQPLNERELAVELMLGLAPIREALRRLESDRLVVIYPRRGIFSAEIGLRDQQLIKEIRMEIEGLAASLAALRATEKEREQLIIKAQKLAQEADMARQIAGDGEVHGLIYKMARNPYLEVMLKQNFNLALRLWYFCNQNMPAKDPRPVDHRPLARAISDGHSERAAHLLREHVQQDSDRVRDLLFKTIG